jgi:hypothetical protein
MLVYDLLPRQARDRHREGKLKKFLKQKPWFCRWFDEHMTGKYAVYNSSTNRWTVQLEGNFDPRTHKQQHANALLSP